ncbi:recombinase family protein [Salmonella enterica]
MHKPKFYAYLRVSRDGQDPDNQRFGLLEYANAKGFAPLHIEEERASRAKDWRTRKIGKLIEQAAPGDIILTPEISRLGGSALAVLDILKTASERGVVVHITKQQIIMDGSLQSDIMATALGLAAQIERHFIQLRTTEALQVARERGTQLGRPKGSTGTVLKLDEQLEQVQAYVNLGLPLRRSAELLNVSPHTLRLFLKRRNIKPTKSKPVVSMASAED